MRRSFGSALRSAGCPGRRRRWPGRSDQLPLSPVGSPAVRRSCARSRPPSAVGGVRAAPTPPGGSRRGSPGCRAGRATRVRWTRTATPTRASGPRSDDENLNICENLYAAGTATAAPYWAYDHELPVVPDEDCRENAAGAPYNTSLSGIEFYPSPALLPGRLPGRAVLLRPLARLHLGDAARPGRPAAAWVSVVKFAQRAESPLDLEVGPTATSTTSTARPRS